MAEIKAKVMLKGGLEWLAKEKKREIIVEKSGMTLEEVLKEYNIPLEQIQFAMKGDSMVDLSYKLEDGDEIAVVPIIESG